MAFLDCVIRRACVNMLLVKQNNDHGTANVTTWEQIIALKVMTHTLWIRPGYRIFCTTRPHSPCWKQLTEEYRIINEIPESSRRLDA